ncbi:MAG: NupC/NupG family nucleoside CNT transporter [Candidatus Latescibacterota bacterium]
MTIYNLVSLFGVFAFPAIAWLISENRGVMNFRVILWGIALQLSFAFLIFVFPPGAAVFLWINDVVIAIMGTAAAGAQFVFGRLALSPGAISPSGEESLGFFLAFQGLPTIIFFSALMSILYFFGIMPRLIRAFASVFTRLMRISGAESLCTSSNIFVGIESTLTIRPHLSKMTRSELALVLTAGMATVASNILAVYVFSLQSVFPTIAAHLISASFLSAPAAIIMAKIIVPETEIPETLGQNINPAYDREPNLLMAIINGANAGVKLIVGIVALLIAVLGLVALADLFLTGLGGHINAFLSIGFDWSLQSLFGYAFYPLTLLTGIPLSDAGIISRIIGERIIVTELTAYQDLANLLRQNALSDLRSAVICAYALCGFAHVASLAIFIGGIAAIAPGTTHQLSRIGLRALAAATLACLMTASVAGVFYLRGSILFG